MGLVHVPSTAGRGRRGTAHNMLMEIQYQVSENVQLLLKHPTHESIKSVFPTNDRIKELHAVQFATSSQREM